MEGQAEVATKNKTDPKGGYLNGTLAYLLNDPRTAGYICILIFQKTI